MSSAITRQLLFLGGTIFSCMNVFRLNAVEEIHIEVLNGLQNVVGTKQEVANVTISRSGFVG